jgi:undecaprenyl-diphosphatase
MNNNFELNIIQFIQNTTDYNIFISQLMQIISFPFHLKIFLIIILILFFTNKITKNQVLLLLLSQIIIYIIKINIKRIRPFKVSQKIKLLEKMSYDKFSFPSGHTLNACLLSCILFNNNIYIPLIVGLSRVYLGVHYPSDVIGGIILAEIIFKFYMKN